MPNHPTLGLRWLGHARLRLGPVLLMVAAVGPVSCRQFSTIGDCSALSSLTNARLDELEALNKRNEDAPVAEAYTELGLKFEQLRDDLGALEIEDPTLSSAVEVLSKTLSDASNDCHKYAEHLKSHDESVKNKSLSKQRFATSAMRRLNSTAKKRVKAYESQVRRIDKLCRVRS